MVSAPKMRFGWDMKSVMRSSMLLGSRTKVGKVTFERSIPTLSCEIREVMIEPSSSSKMEVSSGSVSEGGLSSPSTEPRGFTTRLNVEPA